MKFGKRIPWVTLLLGVASVLAFAAGPAVFDQLVWRSDWRVTGAFWRMASGHFVHASASHLAWDLGAFAILGSLVERRSRCMLFAVLASTVLLAEFALRLGDRFDLYCGLSGLDMGLFATAALQVLEKGRKEADRFLFGLGVSGLALAGGKVFLEIFVGSPVLVSSLQSGFSVAWEAHLAGLVAAGLAKGSLTTYQLVGLRLAHVFRPST